jgi:hypothetical protein
MAYDDYQIPTCPMTPDDVFAVIVDLTRQVCGADDDELARLSLDMRIADWLIPFEFLNDMEVAAAFKVMAAEPIGDYEWKRLLSLDDYRTLGCLCRELAPRLRKPLIQPVAVMGDTSPAAGAFLVVRRILRDAGVNVSDLRPSSPIGKYLKANFRLLMTQLSLIASGRLPRAKVVAPAHLSCALGILASLITIMIGMTGVLPLRVMLGSVLLLVGFFIAFCLLIRYVKPRDIRIGAARTFRELCQILVDERLACPGFPVSTVATR